MRDPGWTVGFANDTNYASMAGVVRRDETLDHVNGGNFRILTLRQLPETWAAVEDGITPGGRDVWDVNAEFNTYWYDGNGNVEKIRDYRNSDQ